MQVARPIPEGGGNPEPVAQSQPDGGEPSVILRRGWQVCRDREIVARLDPAEKLLQLRGRGVR